MQSPLLPARTSLNLPGPGNTEVSASRSSSSPGALSSCHHQLQPLTMCGHCFGHSGGHPRLRGGELRPQRAVTSPGLQPGTGNQDQQPTVASPRKSSLYEVAGPESHLCSLMVPSPSYLLPQGQGRQDPSPVILAIGGFRDTSPGRISLPVPGLEPLLGRFSREDGTYLPGPRRYQQVNGAWAPHPSGHQGHSPSPGPECWANPPAGRGGWRLTFPLLISHQKGRKPEAPGQHS